MPVHITGLIKQQHFQTSACLGSLLIIHSAGGQMAPSSHSLTPKLINQFLEQLWVIACAFKFYSLLYEVQFYVNYANKMTHHSNCTCFCGYCPEYDLYTNSSSGTSLQELVELCRLKLTLQIGHKPLIHHRGNTPSSSILLTLKKGGKKWFQKCWCIGQWVRFFDLKDRAKIREFKNDNSKWLFANLVCRQSL